MAAIKDAFSRRTGALWGIYMVLRAICSIAVIAYLGYTLKTLENLRIQVAKREGEYAVGRERWKQEMVECSIEKALWQRASEEWEAACQKE